MNPDELLDTGALKRQAARQSRDPQTRKLLVVLIVLAMLSFTTVVLAGWLALHQANLEAIAGKSLAFQVEQACQSRPVADPELQEICDAASAQLGQAPFPDVTVAIEGAEYACRDRIKETGSHGFVCTPTTEGGAP
jgi:hypothetical protein